MSVTESTLPTERGSDTSGPDANARRNQGSPPTDIDASTFARLMNDGSAGGGSGGGTEDDPSGEGRAPSGTGNADDLGLTRLSRRLSAIAESARRYRPDDAGQAPSGITPPNAGLPAPLGRATTDVAALADLVERYVRQMLVSAPSSPDARVVMRLEGLFPAGTTMTLRRTEGGWSLKIAAASVATERLVVQYAPALQARFAAGRLGRLDIEVDQERAA